MKDINITSASWHEIGNKINIITQLEDLIAEIDINKYTSILNSIFIIFQCYPKNYPARKIEIVKKMRRKTKTLELYLVLDYDKVMAGTNEENLTHIKEVFISGCETFLKPLKGFDWDGFENEILETINYSL